VNEAGRGKACYQILGSGERRRMQTIEVSDEVYAWLVEHKEYLEAEESEGQRHTTFDDVIRDLYAKFSQAVEALDRERAHGG
jgi:predicted CopG family antitoxin